MRPNIAISGLTAAGKTTHALLLAEELGYDYVSATEIMADMIGIDRSEVGAGFWQKHGDAIRVVRDTTNLDRELDERLVSMATNEDRLVFDAWALPWLHKGAGCVSMWISSDLRSRTLKAAVSDENRRPLAWYRDFISKKDSDTRDRFMAIHEFDLFGARSATFTLDLDNSAFITEPTRVNADTGIAGFRRVIRDALMPHLSERSKP